ncbi:glycosyltransferase family 39 protein [Hymenobacter sp. BT175]|uniref:glycosyltransferase family 39 protein n=1 Tax=Hymenobacter translucens TaxID=2886507 RepID=UPI001D0F372E|nr:glycosyltransferase family 39 protein [Hymenobacter translucens]MCC2546773.1 glycosyltransferase family 39 protein [Hymenobacter translucens]
MKRLIPLLLALLKFFIGYLLGSGAYELQRDEYLYLNMGHHLAWGFIEVPPLLAAQAWLTQALGGGYVWVKFWPFLWGALTIYLVARLTQKLGGGWFAVVLAGTCYLASGFARLNFLFQPNSFEVLAFTAVSYALVRYWQRPRPGYLYAAGVVLGLSLLNKYTTFFFLAAVLGAVLLTPHRRLLTTRPFWSAAALVLLLFLPNLIWQLRHGIPFLNHMSELHGTQLVHVSVADFWKDQLLMCFPAVWVWVPGLLALLLYRKFRPFRAVGWLYLLGLGILTVLHGKSYYALGYYPLLFAFGALWLERQLSRLRGARYVQPVVAALPVLIMLPLLPFVYPVLSPAPMQEFGARYRDLGMLRWEDGEDHALPQDYADMLGWQELADKTYAAWQALPAATRPRTLIVCANYGQAGAINYFNRNRLMPEAHSRNGSYLYWWPDLTALASFEHVILVDDEPDDDVPALFARYSRAGTIGNPYAREKGTAIGVGTGPGPAVLPRIRREHQAALAVWEGKKW